MKRDASAAEDDDAGSSDGMSAKRVKKTDGPMGSKGKGKAPANVDSDDSDDSDEEDWIATQTQRHSETDGDVGRIKEVYLEQFMCHNQLKVPLGKNINFLVGENGSGKSAVLVGIQLGLGGKTGNTGRGGVSTVVMHGKESALVRITLYNEGDDAFDPKRYGKLIAVERIIRKATGASQYKLMNGVTKKVISTRRSDLTLITDHFDIQVDNPIAILCQEEAKKFIKSKDPKAMYTNFMKATQMDKMSRDYEVLERELEVMKGRIADKKGGSSALQTDYKEAEQKFRDLEKLREMEAKRDVLFKEAVWASVREREGDVLEKEAAIAENADVVCKTGKKIGKWHTKRAELAGKMKPLEEEVVAVQKQVEAGTAELEQASKALKSFRMVRKRDEAARKDIERDLKDKESSTQRLQRQLKDQKAENDAEDLDNERQERQVAIQALEKELGKIRDSRQKAATKHNTLIDGCQQIEAKIVDAERAVNDRLSDLARAKGQLANLNQTASGGGGIVRRIGLYGPAHTKLNAAIRRERWKDTVPPIGPLGAYVDLVDESYSAAIEKAMGRNQTAYACANKEDSATLRKLIMRTLGREGQSVDVLNVKREARFKVHNFLSTDLKREGISTVEQMISVENSYVYNVLLNFSKMERVGLAENGPELRRIIYESRNDVGKMSRFYTKDGDLAYPGAGRRYYMNKDQRRGPRMTTAKVDMSQRLAEATADVQRCSAEFESVKKAKAELTREKQRHTKLVRDADKAVKHCRQKINEVESEIASMHRAIDQMQEANVEADYTYLEDEILSSQQACSEKQAAFNAAKQAELEKRKAETPYSDAVKRLKAEAQRLGEQELKVQQAVAKLADSQDHATKSVAKYTADLEQAKAEAKDHEAELKVLQDGLQDELESAAKLSGGRVETQKRSSDVEKEMEAIEAQIKSETKKKGDPQVITDEYKRAKDTWENAIRDIASLEKFSKMLEKIFANRETCLGEFKENIGKQTKLEFVTALAHRNYTGKMKLKHDSETIEFTVSPREESRKVLKQAKDTSAETGRANTLSGGERSFTTASFILSLWAPMDTPFRALDEFDVFMDAVNRQIAIRMMIDAARRQTEKQFILLSPLTLKIIDDLDGPDIRVIRMKAPIRGQTTLVDTLLN